MDLIRVAATSKIKGFEVSYIRSHPLAVTIHLFLPQICHNEFRLLIGARSAEVTSPSASIREQRLNASAPAPHGRPVTVDQTTE
jgi:hypothetical protein